MAAWYSSIELEIKVMDGKIETAPPIEPVPLPTDSLLTLPTPTPTPQSNPIIGADESSPDGPVDFSANASDLSSQLGPGTWVLIGVLPAILMIILFVSGKRLYRRS
jgi:hypothetical protein